MTTWHCAVALFAFVLATCPPAAAQEQSWQLDILPQGNETPVLGMTCTGGPECSTLLSGAAKGLSAEGNPPAMPAEPSTGEALAQDAGGPGARLEVTCTGEETCNSILAEFRRRLEEVQIPAAPGGPIKCKNNPSCMEPMGIALEEAAQEVIGGNLFAQQPHPGTGSGSCARNPACRDLVFDVR